MASAASPTAHFLSSATFGAEGQPIAVGILWFKVWRMLNQSLGVKFSSRLWSLELKGGKLKTGSESR